MNEKNEICNFCGKQGHSEQKCVAAFSKKMKDMEDRFGIMSAEFENFQ